MSNTEKLILVFDTETTGLPQYKLPSDDPSQPHLVEIAAHLFHENGTLISGFSAVVKPNGWVIPDEIIAIHGITNEYAQEHGIDEEEAVATFLTLHDQANVRVAHNVGFDDRIMRIAIKRYFGDEKAEQYKALPSECTAALSKPIIKLPPTEAMMKTNFKNSFKNPNLKEAFKHFTGEEMQESHRAEADVIACAKVYFAIKAGE